MAGVYVYVYVYVYVHVCPYQWQCHFLDERAEAFFTTHAHCHTDEAVPLFAVSGNSIFESDTHVYFCLYLGTR